MGNDRGDHDLHARIDELEARLAIIDLEGTYARTWDTADAAGWAGCFTPDGAFVLLAVGSRPEKRIAGHDALAAFCRAVNEVHTGLHLMHLPQLRVDGDRATGRVHFEFKSVVRADPKVTTHHVTLGWYDVAYVRTPDGWRMHERLEQGVASEDRTFFDV
jgi:uncharacterized protein (TIGR02246 family)